MEASKALLTTEYIKTKRRKKQDETLIKKEKEERKEKECQEKTMKPRRK